MRESITIKHFPLLSTLSVLLITACASGPNLDSSGNMIPVRSYQESYKVAKLDKMTVKLAHHKAPVTLSVDPDGNVEFPPGSGDTLKVEGLSADELSEKLIDRDSEVKGIEISEYQGSRLTVTGEVNIQTTFDIPDAPTRVLDAIATAGGFTPLADQSDVWLTRHEAGRVEVYRLNMRAVQRGESDSLNMLLQPGDRIFIPKSFL